MIQKLPIVLLVLFFSITMKSQELPFREIPEYPADYSSGNLVSRMIDGLGFRYHWATEGLTPKDLAYRPTEESRTVLATLQHIYGMSEIILNAPSATPNVRPTDFSGYPYEQLRKMTLENLKAASETIAGKQAKDFEDFVVVFQRGDKQSSFPYWNMVNGMLSDCIYHTGQITLMRRTTGNPINPKVSVFRGTVSE